MRACQRLHPEDVERGDQFLFSNTELSTERLKQDGLPPTAFIATVVRTYMTHNFGWVFEVRIGDSQGTVDLYLEDDWDLTFVASPTAN